MTKREWLKITALGACGGLLPRASWSAAAEEAPNDEPSAEAQSSDGGDSVEDIVTAFRVADCARLFDPQSPFGLCAAAEILARRGQWNFIPAADVPRRFRGPATELKQDPNVLWAEAESMAAEAVKMAKVDKLPVELVQAIAKFSLVRRRGGLDGPLFYTVELAAGKKDNYQIKYKKGEWARVAVVPIPGLAGLSLKVVNDQSETRGDDRERRPPYVAFVPRKEDGDEFTVTVTNRGKERIVYSLFTN